MSTRAGEVLQTFYRLKKERGNPVPSYFRKELWETAERYLSWCQQEHIDDPLAFLHYRFQCADHTGYPLPLKGICSSAIAKNWREHGEGSSLEAQAYEALVTEAGTPLEQQVRALRLLTRGNEALKAQYQDGRQELCLTEIDLSGGFHPESRYCPTCPVAVRCAAALYRKHGFDVVSLRAGRLHVLPSDVAAAAVR
jgi:hypothetical protein